MVHSQIETITLGHAPFNMCSWHYRRPLKQWFWLKYWPRSFECDLSAVYWESSRLVNACSAQQPRPDKMGRGDDDDDSSNVKHDKAMLAHLSAANNKSVLEDISCWPFKIISNFSKAANKSWLVWSKQMPIGIGLCPDCIPLFWCLSTIWKLLGSHSGGKKQFSLTLFSRNKIKLFIISACINHQWIICCTKSVKIIAQSMAIISVSS